MRRVRLACVIMPLALLLIPTAGRSETIAENATLGSVELLEQLVGVRDATPPVVSPDGTRVAYSVIEARLATNAYAVSWFVAPTDGSAPPRRVHSGGDLRIEDGFPVAGRAAWAPGSRAFAFPATSGNEAALHVHDVAAGTTMAAGPAFSTIGEFVFVDDNTILATAGPRPPKFRALAPYPRTGGLVVPHGEGRNVALGLAGFAEQPSPGDSLAVRLITITPERAAAAERTAQAGEAFARGAQVGALSAFMIPAVHDPITAQQGTALRARFPSLEDAVALAATGDGRSVAFLADSDGGSALFVDDGSGRPPVPVATLRDASAPLLAWTPSGDAFVLATSSPEGWRVRAFGRSGARRGEWAGTGQIMALGGFDRAGRLILLWSDVDTPGDIMALDLSKGPEAPLVRLTTLNPGFAALATPRPRILQAPDRYGRPVRARVYVPEPCGRAGGRCPVIVHIYGSSGFPRGGNGDEWPFLELVRRGFVVVDADPPLDEADYSNQGTAEGQRIYVDGPVSGAIALVDALAREGLVDPDRAGIVGLSFGAMVASWAALKTDRFAATSSAGIDLYYAMQGLVNGTYDRFLLDAIAAGDGAAVLEYLGMNVAPTVRAAMLSHEPEEEYRAFLPLIGLLRAFGRPVEQIVYADEGHVKTQPRNRLEIYRRNVQWFEFWLAGREDPDPVDPDQYARWRNPRSQSTAKR